MGILDYIGIVVVVSGTLLASVKIYAKEFTTQLAKDTATLITLEQKTIIEETVRTEFSKQKNTHQIVTAEYARMRFARLDELVRDLYELKSQSEAFIPIRAFDKESEVQPRIKAIGVAHLNALKALHMAAMYIDDDVREKTEIFMEECKKIIALWHQAFMSKGFIKQSNEPEYEEDRRLFLEDYKEATTKLQSTIDSLPELFKSLQAEYRKHLGEIK